ncbi:MAG: hypothetical protein ACT4OI_05780 [Methanobacteriota archaeon]
MAVYAGALDRLRLSLARLDTGLVRVMTRHGPRALRVSLGLVFAWFGALKLVGESPVSHLAEGLVPGIAPALLVTVLGLWEVAVGIGLLVGKAMRIVLGLLWFQMAGTFALLALRPDRIFVDGNPFLLTLEGEFVVKNLVLISAGLVLGGTLRPLGKGAGARGTA